MTEPTTTNAPLIRRRAIFRPEALNRPRRFVWVDCVAAESVCMSPAAWKVAHVLPWKVGFDSTGAAWSMGALVARLHMPRTEIVDALDELHAHGLIVTKERPANRSGNDQSRYLALALPLESLLAGPFDGYLWEYADGTSLFTSRTGRKVHDVELRGLDVVREVATSPLPVA